MTDAALNLSRQEVGGEDHDPDPDPHVGADGADSLLIEFHR